ncbi:MAG: hypothetical protein LAN84_14310 [Acidobacteriia bacterium]|nr:hypothetical protein [Terriglobia bacterium]
MEILTQLQQNRRIIHDFAATTLAAIPGFFARLTYVASLRDLSSGNYEHAGLEVLYPQEAVQQALRQCHEELFERILEMPLEAQEKDLRACLSGMESGLCSTVEHWQSLESYRILIPEAAPDYLKTLFCSNLRALLEILKQDCRPGHRAA